MRGLMRSGRARDGRERGSASVELVGVLPFLFVAVLVAAQLALAGHSLWSAAVASRAGARAALVGDDAAAAARATLPPALRKASVVREEQGVSVAVPVPRLLPGMPRLRVGSRTSMDGDGGG